MGGVREDCHPMDFGGDFLEQLQLLAKGSAPTLWDNPVIFPPGRARLSMSPSPTGSRKLVVTMGMVPVAFLAANVACVDVATMTSTLRRTSPAAKSANRSGLPAAKRES